MERPTPYSLFKLLQSTLIALLYEVENSHININPVDKQLLLPERIDEVARRITEAIKPKVAAFLLSGKEFTIANLLSLCDGFSDRHQGVYANIVTNEKDALYAKIYVGSAAGPYKQSLKDRRRDRGLHQRIMTHGQQSIRKHSQKKHEKLLQNPGIRSNWLIMVSFQQNVSRDLVNIAHAVMTILFRACESSPYIICRPIQLPDCPQSWGLNELGPLGQHGLASYNRIRHGPTKEEVVLVHETNVLAGQRCQDLKRQKHYDRLKSRGPIHVNVLVMNGIIKRFFITPMTKNDGCHIDITRPRAVGLTYGLQISRSVDVQFDLEPTKDHSHPYATQASSASFARKLGILISGKYACGPQIGNRFDHWIQCNRCEAISKAENLIRKIRATSEIEATLETETKPENRQGTMLNDWLKSARTSISDRMTVETHNVNSLHPNPPLPVETVPNPDEENDSYDPDAFTLCLRVLRQLSRKVQKNQIKAMATVRKYLSIHSPEELAKKIAKAIRPGVVSFLRIADRFEVSRLLSLKGDLEDRSQGVYADVITTPDPSYVRIYIGSAAGVYKGRKDSGLSRRIKEHMSSIKRGSHPQSGILHTKELEKAAAQPNFIILVRFFEEVETPVVRIAEALMTILFHAWDNHTFQSIRPRALTPIPRHFGLNNANPLTGGFVASSDLAHPEDFQKREEYMARCRLMGKRLSAENMARSLRNAREGGPVTITRRSDSKK